MGTCEEQSDCLRVISPGTETTCDSLGKRNFCLYWETGELTSTSDASTRNKRSYDNDYGPNPTSGRNQNPYGNQQTSDTYGASDNEASTPMFSRPDVEPVQEFPLMAELERSCKKLSGTMLHACSIGGTPGKRNSQCL